MWCANSLISSSFPSKFLKCSASNQNTTYSILQSSIQKFISCREGEREEGRRRGGGREGGGEGEGGREEERGREGGRRRGGGREGGRG